MAMREMAWALRLQGISPQCKLVAVYIGDLSAPDCIAVVQLTRLCPFACIDESAARSAIEELAIATGMSWEETTPGTIECHLPLSSEQEEKVRGPDTSPLSLYVMSCGDRTKIGISRDVKGRRLSLQFFNANPVVVEYSVVGPAYLVRRAERAAHQSLADTRIHGEWYTITVGRAIAVANIHLRDAGVAVP